MARLSRGAALAAVMVAALSVGQPAAAKGIFGKLGKLADKVERKVDQTDQRVTQGERTKSTAESVMSRLGIKQGSTTAGDPVEVEQAGGVPVEPVDKVEQAGFIRRQVGRDVNPDQDGQGTLPEPDAGTPEMMGSPDDMGMPPQR